MYWSAVLLLCLTPIYRAIELKEFSINIGGIPTTIREYPYLVSIRYDDHHICGGSIIRPGTILTAGHCVYSLPAYKLSIRAGSDFRTAGGIVVGARSYRVHPRFWKINLTYDIGLLYLNQSLPFSDTIRPIPLYTKILLAGEIVIATGWGTLFEGGELSDIVRSVSFPIVSRRVCLRIFESKVTPSMFCAGVMDGSRDTCQGDSGGPLALNGELAGITSQGNGCGRPGSPGIYTKIPLLVSWINEYA